MDRCLTALARTGIVDKCLLCFQNITDKLTKQAIAKNS